MFSWSHYFNFLFVFFSVSVCGVRVCHHIDNRFTFHTHIQLHFSSKLQKKSKHNMHIQAKHSRHSNKWWKQSFNLVFLVDDYMHQIVFTAFWFGMVRFGLVSYALHRVFAIYNSRMPHTHYGCAQINAFVLTILLSVRLIRLTESTKIKFIMQFQQFFAFDVHAARQPLSQHNDDHWIGIAKRKGLREFRCKTPLKLRQIHTTNTIYCNEQGSKCSIKIGERLIFTEWIFQARCVSQWFCIIT